MPDDRAPDEKTPEVRSPTETLVKCLEDFGESEPLRAIVIYSNVGGELCWSYSGPPSYTEIIGLLTCVRAKMLEQFLR